MEAVQHLKAQAVPSFPYVFATQTGKYLSYRNMLAMMEMACEAAGVEHRGLHALRHSFASNLCARGVEIKVISKLLGHPSTQITYDRYVRFFEGEIDDTLRQAGGDENCQIAFHSSYLPFRDTIVQSALESGRASNC